MNRGYYDMVRQSQNPEPKTPAPTRQCAHDYWIETSRDYINNQSVTRHFQCRECPEVRAVSLTEVQARGLPPLSPKSHPMDSTGCIYDEYPADPSGISIKLGAAVVRPQGLYPHQLKDMPEWGPTMGWKNQWELTLAEHKARSGCADCTDKRMCAPCHLKWCAQ